MTTSDIICVITLIIGIIPLIICVISSIINRIIDIRKSRKMVCIIQKFSDQDGTIGCEYYPKAKILNARGMYIPLTYEQILELDDKKYIRIIYNKQSTLYINFTIMT